MIPADLSGLIDKAIRDLLSLSGGLTAKDENSKPAITPKELTEGIRAAVDWYKLKNAPKDDAWGAKLPGAGNRGQEDAA